MTSITGIIGAEEGGAVVNEAIKNLFNRKSVRAFESRAVSPEDKDLIFEAAAQAPTAGCQQLYTILDVTDQAIKDALAVTCDHQPFIAKAPVILIFCADCRKWYNAYLEAGCTPRAPGPGDLTLAVEDAIIAAQNAVTAAESLGLGSCYIGDILEQYEAHRALLHLPEWVLPAGMLVIGYPTEQQKGREKPRRFEREYVVQENTYRDLSGAELRRMFDGRTGGRGFDDFLAAFCTRKYNSDFSREMTRSVAEYWKQYEGGDKA
ncbi:MAG: nitroreductase [Clostridia bacterium]|nr:nitroreductase [Clostridia bacterium]